MCYSFVGEQDAQDSIINRANVSMFSDDEIESDSEETVSVESIG